MSNVPTQGRYLLITVEGREISIRIFSTKEAAQSSMRSELEETMMDSDEYELETDYGIDENSAWSNCNCNCNCDWKIIKI